MLVDLQNEFLDPEQGNFPILEPSSDDLLDRLKLLVLAFRDGDTLLRQSRRNLVIWVKAEYSSSDDSHDKQGPEEVLVEGSDEESGSGCKNSPKDHFLSGTHTGKTPCCVPGSHGARFHPEIESLVLDSVDHVVTKTRFSAFAGTDLRGYLMDKEVEEVWIAGLMSSVCVLATLVDGLKECSGDIAFGVVEDCLGYRRLKSHEKAMEKMRALGMEGREEIRADDTGKGVRFIQSMEFTKPKLYYVNGSIPSWRVMIALHEKGIPYNSIRMRVMSRPKPTRTPEFLNLNERGKTPVFIDYALPESATSHGSADQTRTIVNESLSILQYIEDYYPFANPLLPPFRHRALRAETLALIQESENIHWIYDGLEDAFFEAKTSASEGNRPEAWSEFLRVGRAGLIKAVEDELQHWEVYLSGSRQRGGLRAMQRAQRRGPFLVGTKCMTLADCAFYPILSYMKHRGFNVEEENGDGDKKWPALERYVRFMEGLESVKKAVPEGWEKPGKTNIFTGVR